MKMEIDLKVILLLILFIFTAQIEIYSIFILFILLHELTHIFVGYCFGMRVASFRLNIFGFSAQMYNYKFKKSFIKIITYLAGPMFNLICAVIFYYLNISDELKMNLVYTNFILGIFNLLPILPLDGGRIVKEILKKFYGNKISSIIMLNISKGILVFFSIIYAFLILKLKNIAILCLIAYMWYLYFIEERKVNTLKRAYEVIEKT